MPLIEDTPETMLRADLWHTMTVSELAKQQDLMTQKITAIMNLMGPQTSPSVLAMYSALQRGSNELNKWIETKNAQEKTMTKS